MYYWAYLAEEYHKPGDYTIAVGCKGSRNGRCTFSEFLTHIWAPGPDPPGEEGSKIAPIPEDDEFFTTRKGFEKTDMASLTISIRDWEDEDSGKKIQRLTGNINADKLMSGLTSDHNRYFEVLSKIGKPIADAIDGLRDLDDSTSKQNKKFLRTATSAATLVLDLRRKDYAPFRLQWVNDKLRQTLRNPNFQCAEKGAARPATQGFVGQWMDVSVDDTIKLNGNVADIKDQLTNALNDYRTSSDTAKEHTAALDAITDSANVILCPR